MHRGSTPTHFFNVLIDTSRIKKIKIIYMQNDRDVLSKRTEDCTIEKGKITTSLTQEETFMFAPNKIATAIMRVLTHDDQCLISRPLRFSVEDCFDDEVLE